jgi:hypothetical protein
VPFFRFPFLHFNLEKVWTDIQVVFRHAPGREEKERVEENQSEHGLADGQIK